MKWLIRTFRAACVIALVLVMLLYAAVQFQQRLLRWRAEQLMADMHRIRLYQSTWSDAQRLMHRWGKWGHYDGSCTSANCRYQISLSDLSYARFGWIMQHGGFRIYNWCGGRSARLTVSFTVHDGTTWRETAEIGVTASPRPLSGGDGLPVTLLAQCLHVIAQVAGVLGLQFASRVGVLFIQRLLERVVRELRVDREPDAVGQIDDAVRAKRTAVVVRRRDLQFVVDALAQMRRVHDIRELDLAPRASLRTPAQ